MRGLRRRLRATSADDVPIVGDSVHGGGASTQTLRHGDARAAAEACVGDESVRDTATGAFKYAMPIRNEGNNTSGLKPGTWDAYATRLSIWVSANP